MIKCYTQCDEVEAIYEPKRITELTCSRMPILSRVIRTCRASNEERTIITHSTARPYVILGAIGGDIQDVLGGM